MLRRFNFGLLFVAMLALLAGCGGSGGGGGGAAKLTVVVDY